MSKPTWCLFTGGSLDGTVRLVQFDPEPGDRYEHFAEGNNEVYEWDGVQYVHTATTP